MMQQEGALTKQRFLKLTSAMEQEQEANQKRLCDLMEMVLHRLIHKILVDEVKKINGQKVQEVKIVDTFVGEVAIALD